MLFIGRAENENENKINMLDMQLSVAPMMDWTDRHCRVFHRAMTRRARLYTEMLTTGAILHGDRARLLGFDAREHPVALQLGGSEPRDRGRGDAAIKSARRVFEIMEFFDRERRPLGLKSICETLDYPVSSGAAMLKSLVSLGYLEYDRKTQIYLPTMRIAVLGRWVSEQLFSEIKMLPLMEDLRARTRETVIVGTQSDMSAQYVHVLGSNQTLSYSAEPGSLRPLARCVVGLS